MPPVPLLVLEGVGSGSLVVADLVTVLVWIEAPRDVRMARGIERDGEAFAPYWETWAAERGRRTSRDTAPGSAPTSRSAPRLTPMQSGEQFQIEGGGYRAVVTESGGALRVLEHDGRPLIDGFGADEVAPAAAASCWRRGRTGSGTAPTRSTGATSSSPLTEPRCATPRTGWCAGRPGRSRSTPGTRCR